MDWSATTNHKFLNLPNDTLGKYNLYWDTRLTAQLVRPLVEDMKANGQLDYYLTEVEPFLQAAVKMAVRGIPVDTVARGVYQRSVSKELRECDQFIRAEADRAGFTYTEKFPNSKPQVAALLFNHLKLRGAKKTDTGRDSGDQDSIGRALKQLRVGDKQWEPLLHALFHRTRLHTIKTRYLGFQVDDDCRVRPTVKPLHAKTLRYAYDDPPMQQFPQEALGFFKASQGMVFVSADASQLEGRILAVLSGDDVALAVFAAGGDIHKSNTFDLFGWAEADWQAFDDSKREASRDYGKTWFYRFIYGGTALAGDKKLACPCIRWGCYLSRPPVMTLDKEAAGAAEARWLASHPAVMRFHNEVAEFVQRRHFYNLPLGGKRWIAKPWGNDLARELRNIPMQTCASQLMNRCQVKLENEGLPIILQKHDQFVAEVPSSQASDTALVMRQVMEERVPELDYSFPVDVSIGKTLAKYHEVKSPDGLKKCTRQ